MRAWFRPSSSCVEGGEGRGYWWGMYIHLPPPLRYHMYSCLCTHVHRHTQTHTACIYNQHMTSLKLNHTGGPGSQYPTIACKQQDTFRNFHHIPSLSFLQSELSKQYPTDTIDPTVSHNTEDDLLHYIMGRGGYVWSLPPPPPPLLLPSPSLSRVQAAVHITTGCALWRSAHYHRV